MDGTSRQSNSGRTWEVAGTWGRGRWSMFWTGSPFFLVERGEMGEWILGTARLKATDHWEKGSTVIRGGGAYCLIGVSTLCPQAIFWCEGQCFYDSAGPLPARALLQSCAWETTWTKRKQVLAGTCPSYLLYPVTFSPLFGLRASTPALQIPKPLWGQVKPQKGCLLVS